MLTLHDGPAIRQPQLRLLVAAGAHEFQVLGVRDRPVGEQERLQIQPMSRLLVVKAETGALIADVYQSAGLRHERQRRSRLPGRLRTALIDRRQRVAGEQMFDVGQEQLLMLLLVVQPQCHRLREGCCELGPRQQRLHVLIDMSAVSQYCGYGRTGQKPAAGALVHRADEVVVRIEQIAEALVVAAIIAARTPQHELLEEPAGVRQMPLRRTRVRHGLHDVILILQGLAEPNRGIAYAAELLGQRRLGRQGAAGAAPPDRGVPG